MLTAPPQMSVLSSHILSLTVLPAHGFHETTPTILCVYVAGISWSSATGQHSQPFSTGALAHGSARFNFSPMCLQVSNAQNHAELHRVPPFRWFRVETNTTRLRFYQQQNAGRHRTGVLVQTSSLETQNMQNLPGERWKTLSRTDIWTKYLPMVTKHF